MGQIIKITQSLWKKSKSEICSEIHSQTTRNAFYYHKFASLYDKIKRPDSCARKNRIFYIY